jgi:hypothetical protein
VKLFSAVALFALMATPSFAKDVFVMSKSIREKNMIHYDVKVTNCKLSESSLTAFWLLGEKDGTPRQELTPKEVPDYRPKIVHSNDQEIEFVLGAFDKIENEITDHPISIKLVNCEPRAYVRLNGEDIQMTRVHATISLLKMGVKYLTVTGKKADGSDFSYRINP